MNFKAYKLFQCVQCSRGLEAKKISCLEAFGLHMTLLRAHSLQLAFMEGGELSNNLRARMRINEQHTQPKWCYMMLRPRSGQPHTQGVSSSCPLERGETLDTRLTGGTRISLC